MPTWSIACVQMDCRIADVPANLAAVLHQLRDAAGRGAQVVVFPECILTGYCFHSLEEALPHAEPLPGPTSEIIAAECRRLGVFAVVGTLELAGKSLFNSAMLVGPDGLVGSYRKIHLPFLGVDRFTTPGDRPFAVQDLGGLRIGMNICYDGSFPESARILALLGADLVVLPTNWPEGVIAPLTLAQARTLENNIFYAAVNRVGEERGFRFIGQSRIFAHDGAVLAEARSEPGILVASIDPEKARAKRLVKVPGEYEVDRVNHRRPEMYGVLCQKSG